ncbi:hypothetical protein T08_6483 [Trichinella sp. T8]|nr:hypothetical protein T08_6483 [Trichinella sp. T8]
MAENLHLVLNERVHEGRVYNLKHTNMQDKQLTEDAGVQSTRTLMWTQSWIVILMQMIAPLTMTSFIKWRKKCSQATSSGGIENHTADLPRRSKHFQRIKVLERQCTENGHKNFQDFRQLSSSWRFHPTGECRKENLSILSEHSVWSMDGTFKIVPEWYKDLSTYREIFDNLILKATALGWSYNHPDPCTAGDISGGQHTRLLFPFLPSSSTEGDGSWDANQLHQ